MHDDGGDGVEMEMLLPTPFNADAVAENVFEPDSFDERNMFRYVGETYTATTAATTTATTAMNTNTNMNHKKKKKSGVRTTSPFEYACQYNGIVKDTPPKGRVLFTQQRASSSGRTLIMTDLNKLSSVHSTR